MVQWIKEFYEMLMDTNAYENGNLKKALELKYKNIPKRLYKYYGLNNYSISNFKKDVVWLSYPSSFNDPFDSSLLIDARRIIMRVYEDKKFISNFIKKHFPDYFLSDDEIEGSFFDVIKGLKINQKRKKEAEIVKKVIFDYIDNTVQNDMEDFWKRLNQSLNICCFSESNTSVIMWSHYANNHKGFCLEYDFSELPYSDIRNIILYPIFYSGKRYDITDMFIKKNVDSSLALKASLHKSKDWKYEKEWRMIIPGGVLNETEYTVPCPKAVYLGNRMEEENISIIKNIAIGKNIPIYKMALSKNKNYEMEVIKFENE